MEQMKATATAGSNIAFVKYWGKKDTLLNIPMNPSISMTLDESLSTTTTIEFSGSQKEDELTLNNVKMTDEKLDRASRFIDILRERAGIRYRAKIATMNSFPTGSGIASSASGFAALCASAAKALHLDLDEKELSAYARRGSGSACRSILGGFVLWEKEYAVQLEKKEHWPELRDMVAIVSSVEKKKSSRDAMQQTVEKSSLYRKRQQLLPATIRLVETAIARKDFPALMSIIMKESDNMHACIEQAGIRYLNGRSIAVKEKIINLNKRGIVAGYTFDAGPNCHIITLAQNTEKILKALESLNIRLIISGPGNGIKYISSHLF